MHIFHDWRAVKGAHATVGAFWDKNPTWPITLIWEKCGKAGCGATRQIEKDGYWSLEDLYDPATGKAL